VLEPLKVQGQASSRRRRMEPFREVAGFRRWKLLIPSFTGEFDDRLWPEPTVEMIMEENLGSAFKKSVVSFMTPIVQAKDAAGR
jgi:hypothetical protein